MRKISNKSSILVLLESMTANNIHIPWTCQLKQYYLVSLTIKMSGLKLVTSTLGGTEPPPGARKPGKSEYKCDPLTGLGLINAMIFDKTES